MGIVVLVAHEHKGHVERGALERKNKLPTRAQRDVHCPDTRRLYHYRTFRSKRSTALARRLPALCRWHVSHMAMIRLILWMSLLFMDHESRKLVEASILDTSITQAELVDRKHFIKVVQTSITCKHMSSYGFETGTFFGVYLTRLVMIWYRG